MTEKGGFTHGQHPPYQKQGGGDHHLPDHGIRRAGRGQVGAQVQDLAAASGLSVNTVAQANEAASQCIADAVLRKKA